MNRKAIMATKAICINLKILVLLLMTCHSGTCQDQDSMRETSAERPKVGLVLSGGSARGLAHIGVLEWFEKNRIPVDYIGGTSMGGLIGGMYAIGMSPQEMRALLKSVNWVATFGTGIRYQDRSFRRKEDSREYPVELELGLKHGVSGPPGLSTGIEVDLLIDKITLPYSTTDDFDDLPIPFFCIGTDILNAEEVLMKSGELSTAMRATMSLPGIFPPVKREGKWLVDGGVLNNIPTDVMRSLGPDVVIAVNAGSEPGKEESIQSFLGVATQTLEVFMAVNDRENLKLADILILPKPKNLQSIDFTKVDRTADSGFTAAEEKSHDLRRYALDENSWQQHKARRAARKKSAQRIPLAVEVTGVEGKAKTEIENQFSIYAGSRIDLDQLERDLTRLIGEGRYQSASYGFVNDDSGNDRLQIRITEKTYAPPTLNFALGIAGSDISELDFALGTRLTLFDIAGYGTEWRNDLNLGIDSRFVSEFYRPFGRRGLLSQFGLYRPGVFAAGRVFYDRGNRNLFAGEKRVADFEVNNLGLGADFGYGTWRSELRIGGVLQRFDGSLSTGTAPIDELRGTVSFARIRFAFDGANSPTIPTSGVRFVSEARYYFDSPLLEQEFPSAFFTASVYNPAGPKGTVFGAGTLGTTFTQDAAPPQKFALGGPFKLGAFNQGEFIGNHQVLLSAGYYHSILELPAIIGRNIWVIGWYDLGGAFDDFSKADYVSQISAGLAMDTKIGPFAFIFALGEGGKNNIYFSFGRFF